MHLLPLIMNFIFAHLLRKGILVFMDDILIYSNTLAEHLQLLQQVFDILRSHQLYLKKPDPWSQEAGSVGGFTRP